MAPDPYRTLCDALGWPPIAGGSPELDEETPVSQDTPDPAASEEEIPAVPAGDDTETIDWQKRYEDLRPEHSRATQEAAEYRNLIEAAQQGDPEALRLLDISAAPEPEEEEYLDPEEELRAEVAQLKDHLGNQQQEAEYAQLEQLESDYISESLGALEKESQIELDKETKDIIAGYAELNRAADDTPDVEGSFKRFLASLEAHHGRIVKSKKQAAKVPVGGPGEDKLNLSDTEQRQAAMVADMESESQ